jgi:hypothetical protein
MKSVRTDADSDPSFYFDADPDPDPACHFDEDAGPDSDPTFHADPDPDSNFQIKAQTFKSAHISSYSISCFLACHLHIDAV